MSSSSYLPVGERAYKVNRMTTETNNNNATEEVAQVNTVKRNTTKFHKDGDVRAPAGFRIHFEEAGFKPGDKVIFKKVSVGKDKITIRIKKAE